MFVHPSQVAELIKRHPEIVAARLVIQSEDNYDQMTLHCEVADTSMVGLNEKIAASVRDVCKLRGEVSLLAVGTLANDGKVIDDQRKFE